MNIHLISSILKSIWAIDPEAALSYAPLLNNLIGTGIKLEFSFDGQEFILGYVPSSGPVRVNRWTNMNDPDEVPEGSIAVIPLRGPLMKEDQFCGPSGTATIGRLIKSADKSPNIDAIILHIDSPGGTVDGTIDLSRIVAETKKPVVAFADGLMASAALWIGSAANEVVAAHNKVQIGSVGVILSFADLQPAYEAIGVKFHSIVADQSPDKNKLFEMVRSGKYEDYKKEVLNPLADEFIQAMKSYRPNVKEDQLTGKLFFAENLIGTLIDSIGNFDHAVQRASALAQQHKIQINSNQSISTPMKKQYASVNKVLGVDQLEAQDEGVFLNEDQVAALDAAIDQGNQDAAALQSATDARTKAEADLATANASIQQKEQEIAQLKQGAGADPAKVVTENDPAGPGAADGNVTDPQKSFEENLATASKLL